MALQHEVQVLVSKQWRGGVMLLLAGEQEWLQTLIHHNLPTGVDCFRCDAEFLFPNPK